MNLIDKYFPELSATQRELLHSLALVKFLKFTPGTTVLDLGTGGGLPGLPLAVYFPEVSFHLVDRTGKKLKVAQDIATQLGLTNVTIQHGDVAEVKGKFDFVVSRAVMPLPDMVKLVRRLISHDNSNALPNGLLCLKGGDLEEELSRYRNEVLIDNISSYFKEDFFATKKIVYLPI